MYLTFNICTKNLQRLGAETALHNGIINNYINLWCFRYATQVWGLFPQYLYSRDGERMARVPQVAR